MNSSFSPVVGWNEYAKEHCCIAQDALWWWKYYNTPIMVLFTTTCEALHQDLNTHCVLLEEVKN